MTRSIRTALAALLFAALPSVTVAADPLPENVFAALPGDDIQDVLVLGDTRPLFVRLHIRVDGNGFRTVWADFASRLHRFLDGDGNGVVTLPEAQRGNWQQLLATSRFIRPMASTVAPAAAALDSNPKDGTVSIAELESYLARTLGFGAFGLEPGSAPDPKSKALFSHLDLDQDGALSAAELTAGATDACVARLDFNGDELLSLAEMKPFENAYADRFRPVLVAAANPGAGDSLPVVALGAGEATPRIARRLIEKYDRGNPAGPRDGCLSATELGTTPEALRCRDADGDGSLSAAELESFLARPAPDVEFNVVLVQSGASRVPLELTGTPRLPVSAPSALKGSPDRPLEIDAGGFAVELAVEENLFNNRLAVNRQFDDADSDQNGYLDKTEAMRPAFLQQIFSVADRDNDGKLFKKELEAYLDRQSDAVASRVRLTVIDRGRTLFEMLDADGDQKLGMRELRQAPLRLAALDRDGDGTIAQNEIPHHYRLAVGRGPLPLRRGIAIERYDQPDPPGRMAGPSWFEKMDRNRDGDVSWREFLGPREQFRRFDTDGDGLIGPSEAARRQ